MAFFLDAQETAHRFGDYIEELRTILTTNKIKFGSPDNLCAFARRLQSDDLLPGDLSRMVESIVEREDSTISLRAILSIIAIAVGGPAIAESHHGLSKPLNIVLDFLIHSGSWSPAGREHTGNISSTPSPVPTNDDSELIQTFSRLQSHAREDQLHFDSIEQRRIELSRIEPRLVAVSSPVSLPQNDPMPLAYPPMGLPSISDDLPLSNFARRPAPKTNAYFAWILLSGKKLAVPPLFATIAGGALLYIGSQRSVKPSIHPSAPAPAAEIIHPPAPAPLAIVSPQPSTYSPQDLPATRAPDSKPTKPQPGRPLQSIDSHKAASSSSALPASLKPVPPPQAPEPIAKTRRDVAYTVPHGARSAPSSPRIVDVSSGVMAANLLSASPPSYPKLASLTRMQGEVVMQAIISKDGTVQNLHVIQGHRLLRSAAKNSARTWRYRPYLVNGKPVEVATIVSVDFTLGH